MKPMSEVLLVGTILVCAVVGQEPALRKGVSVQLASAEHAVEMRAADAQDATVVAITAEGKVYAGVERTEPGALRSLSAGTVYVKADSRAQFQTVLAVLDALRGKSVVLLAAPPKNVEGKMVPPYGMKVTVPR
uniref:Biopolymer transport protein ExbD/TolR n=1 Tax=Solibacter usitatus (strain Ellin6076) TaxID=234267 RepID=Q028U5_SOLUE